MLALSEAWHHHRIHPGVMKQALDMQRWFQIDKISLYNAIKQVKKGFRSVRPAMLTIGMSRGKAKGR